MSGGPGAQVLRIAYLFEWPDEHFKLALHALRSVCAATDTVFRRAVLSRCIENEAQSEFAWRLILERDAEGSVKWLDHFTRDQHPLRVLRRLDALGKVHDWATLAAALRPVSEVYLHGLLT